MKQTRGSLGGQNTVGRHTGARSSRALSTLFKKLRDLDRKISQQDRYIKVAWGTRLTSLQRVRNEMDAKRMQIRLKRKGTPADTLNQ